jgi:hypothetical protein
MTRIVERKIEPRLSEFFAHLIENIGKNSTDSHKIVELHYSPGFRTIIFDYRVNDIHLFYIYTYKNLDDSLNYQMKICTLHDDSSNIGSIYLNVDLLNYHLETLKTFVYKWYSDKIKQQAEKFNKKQEELEYKINLIY